MHSDEEADGSPQCQGVHEHFFLPDSVLGEHCSGAGEHDFRFRTRTAGARLAPAAPQALSAPQAEKN